MAWHGHHIHELIIVTVACIGSKEGWASNVNYRWGRGSWDHTYPGKIMKVDVYKRRGSYCLHGYGDRWASHLCPHKWPWLKLADHKETKIKAKHKGKLVCVGGNETVLRDKREQNILFRYVCLSKNIKLKNYKNKVLVHRWPLKKKLCENTAWRWLPAWHIERSQMTTTVMIPWFQILKRKQNKLLMNGYPVY